MRKLVIFLLLLVSCQLVQLRKTPELLPSVRVGTSSLEIAFSPASSSNVFMCNQGEVFVELRNTGATNIEDGFYTWIVEDQFLKPLTARQGKFSLKGKDEYNPIGGINTSIRLKVQSLDLPEQLDSYSSPLVFQSCYAYSTAASVPVCVDPDIRDSVKNKACKSGTVSLSGGQGAPVAVTKVESAMVPLPEGNKVQPMFAVFVQNLGYGQVVQSKDIEAACKAGGESLLPFADVTVELQSKKLDCKPVPVRIEAGTETKFVCKSPDLYDMSTGTFSSVLTVELNYGYVNTAVFPVTVTRLPQQEACLKQ